MREIRKYRYFVAGFLTLVIFMTGVLVSNLADDYRSEELRSELENDLTQLESNSLQLSYMRSEDLSCETMNTGLRSIIRGYNNRLSHLQSFQDRSLLKSERFGIIKERYIVSGLRYWMFAEEMREECENASHTVLFFTSDLKAEECEDCASVGRQLSLIKKKYDGDVAIFSVPVNMDNGLVEVFETQYNVTDVPVVVVNDDEILRGYSSRQRIEQAMNG